MTDKTTIYMTATEFRRALKALGLSAEDGDLLLVSRAGLYAYKSGKTAVPPHLALALRHMLKSGQRPADYMRLAYDSD